MLRYGENPHQDAFVIDHEDGSRGLLQAKKIQGKPLSYNNFLEGDAALLFLNEFIKEPACVLFKHNSPCGVGVRLNIETHFNNSSHVDIL